MQKAGVKVESTLAEVNSGLISFKMGRLWTYFNALYFDLQEIQNRLWKTRDKAEFNNSFSFVNAPIFLGVKIFGEKFAENMSTLEPLFCS